jgi:hypothetical protein
MDITKIQIRNNSFNNGSVHQQVKQIELFIGGMEFRKDVQSERDINCAKRIANEAGIELYRVDVIQEQSQVKNRIARTWYNQHPKSLDDLDLSFFNLDGKNKDIGAWFDSSWKNDPRPSFTLANGKENAFVLYLDHTEVSDRENDQEDRFILLLFPRTDDGSTDDYDIDCATGDEPVLYEGSNFEALITTIKNNTVTG